MYIYIYIYIYIYTYTHQEYAAPSDKDPDEEERDGGNRSSCSPHERLPELTNSSHEPKEPDASSSHQALEVAACGAPNRETHVAVA